jgi:meso-butanediol dehydrogenase/(S,S)-butanediol dehydrogenase/diacetyl reductase
MNQMRKDLFPSQCQRYQFSQNARPGQPGGLLKSLHAALFLTKSRIDLLFPAPAAFNRVRPGVRIGKSGSKLTPANPTSANPPPAIATQAKATQAKATQKGKTMARRVEGKIIFLTGGSEGIGRATALRLAEEGAHVVIAARRPGPLAETAAAVKAAGGSIETMQFDVADADAYSKAIADTVARHGRLDGLVNNAMSSYRNSILDTTLDAWRRDFAVNSEAVFIGTREALRAMYPRKCGSIVNIASTCGLRALENMASYSASKAALIHFSAVAAMEAAKHGVRVNVVSPGQVLTESLALIHKDAAARAAQVAATIPMLRGGEPIELANVILFMLSDESSYITGTVLPVDGGKTAQLYAPPADTQPAAA